MRSNSEQREESYFVDSNVPTLREKAAIRRKSRVDSRKHEMEYGRATCIERAVAQWARHRAHDQKVGGSIPPRVRAIQAVSPEKSVSD